MYPIITSVVDIQTLIRKQKVFKYHRILPWKYITILASNHTCTYIYGNKQIKRNYEQTCCEHSGQRIANKNYKKKNYKKKITKNKSKKTTKFTKATISTNKQKHYI